MCVESFSYRPNGKVDRSRLPKIEVLAQHDFVEARTDTEKRLKVIWQKLLHKEAVSISDNFFHLGGHSLLATRLVTAVIAEFNVELPVKSVFTANTIAKQAKLIDDSEQLEQSAQLRVLERPAEGAPLSYAQQRMWFINQLEGNSGNYNIPMVYAINSEIDIEVMEQAFKALISRHEVLRSQFVNYEGEGRQIAHDGDNFALTFKDLSALPESQKQQQLQLAITQAATLAIDLRYDSMLNVTLVKEHACQYKLLLTVHHIVADGWSMGLITKEFIQLYDALMGANTAQLPTLAVQYADFAMWQRSWLQGEQLAQQVEFWQHALKGIPAVHGLPTDRPRPAKQSYRGAWYDSQLSQSHLQQLEQLATQTDTTLYMVLQSAFSLLLHKVSHQDDIVLGTPVANRRREELIDLVGFFVNTLVMRTQFSSSDTFSDILSRSKAYMLEAQTHQDVPFEALVESIAPERSLAYSPLFQIMFVLHNNQSVDIESETLQLDIERSKAALAKFDITLSAIENEHGLGFSWEYNTDLFDQQRIARFDEALHLLLSQIIEAPQQAIAAFDVVPTSQDHVISCPSESLQSEDQVMPLFMQAVAQYPDAIALRDQHTSLRYAEVAEQVMQVSSALHQAGVRQHDEVVVMLPRGVDAVLAMLALWRIGAVYMPVDYQWPKERINTICNDNQIQFAVINTETSHVALPETLHTVTMEHLKVTAASEELPDWQGNLNASAYVIHTSGSTGKPKGVNVPHRTLASLLQYQRRSESHLAHQEKTLQFAAMNFDVSLQEICTALTSGSELYIIDQQTRLDMTALLESIDKNEIGRVFVPFAVLSVLCGEALADNKTLPHLKQVVTAGEQLQVTKEVKRFFKRHPECVLINHYGPSETHVVTEYVLSGDSNEWPLLPPIGELLAGNRALLLDKYQKPVLAGCIGELYVSGNNVALGYLNNPSLTAERFLQDDDTFADGIWYRTGDLVSVNEQGQLLYHGRADSQVKLRGFRIELGEIETVLRQHPLVDDAVVSIYQENQLIAYYVAEQACQLTLEQYLQDKLPDYMCPSQYYHLAQLPLTDNGKVDKAQLPVPQQSQQPRFEEPETDTEKALAEIWQQLLSIDSVGQQDNFFSLGGHSLLAMRLVTQLKHRFAIAIGVKQVFETPVLSALAKVIDHAEERLQSQIQVVNHDDHCYPLSYAQSRLWFIDQLEQGSSNYNVPANYRITGNLNVSALQQAFVELSKRHQILRTVYQQQDGGPVQVVLPHSTALTLSDYSDQPRAEEQLNQALQELAATRFNLDTELPVKATLFKLAETEYVLAIVIHHIAVDGWSFAVIERELFSVYQQLCEARPLTLPELSIQYKDYAVWQHQSEQQQALEQAENYWVRALQGAPKLHSLPLDKPRPPVQSFKGGRVITELDEQTSQALNVLAQQQGCSLFMVLESLFAVLLARYSGSQDIMIGTPVAGREREEVEPLVGFFVNTLVLRNRLDLGDGFVANLSDQSSMILDAFEHQNMPFERLVEVLRPERSLNHSPLFQILFALQNNEFDELQLTDLTLEPMGYDRDTSKFDLKLSSLEKPHGGIVLAWEFNSELFDKHSIERLSRSYEVLTQAVLAQPNTPLHQLDIIAEVDHQALAHWNDTDTQFALQAPFSEWFALQAQQTPAAIAISHDDTQVTYAELDKWVNQRASLLINMGVQPGDIVAISIAKSAELIACMLAVLRAGGAYLPIDPDNPQSRIDYLIHDSNAVCVITQQQYHETFSAHRTCVINSDAVQQQLLSCSDDAPGVAISPLMPAYVIYTSGSTGKPKGVMISHGNIANYLAQALNSYFTTDLHGSVLMSSVSFDGTIPNIYLPLLRGKTVYIANSDNLYFSSAKILSESQVPLYIKVTPTQIAVLMSQLTQPIAQQHTLMMGGEEFTTRTYEEIKRLLPNARVYNHYGPTETTIGCSFNEVTTQPEGAAIALGRPIDNTRLYVLDQHKALAPIGAIGELYIAGEGVTLGYLGNASEQTKTRYLPEYGNPGQRMYRTGDLVRWQNDGTVMYFGRNDGQVKLNGYRIETAEIESCIQKLQAVTQACVVIKQDPQGQAILVAYYCAAESISESSLVAHVAASLPEYMVPKAWMPLQQLPLNMSGKIDRKALPQPHWQSSSSYRAPETELQQTLAQIWQRLLVQEKVGLDDNFFALGGHSLLAIQLVSRIRDELQLEVPVRCIFEAPTLAQFSAKISELSTAPEMSHITALPDTKPSPVSYAQQRLLFIAKSNPDSSLYNMPYPYQLNGALNIAVFKQALELIIERQQSLRTRFVLADSLLQYTADEVAVDLTIEELSSHDDATIEQWLVSTSTRPFDLNSDNLFRVHLAAVDSDTYLVNFVFHHVICDGWSIARFWQELSAVYDSLRNAQAPQLSALKVQYRDYAAWQRNWLSGEVLDNHSQYWQSQLEGCPAVHSIPLDYPRPKRQSHRGHFVGTEVDKETLVALKTLSQQQGATLFMTLQTAFAALLSSWSNEEDIVMGTVVANRTHRDVEDLIGFFVNTLVLRNQITGDESFIEALNDAKQMHLGAQAHQDMPFELLVEQLQPERNTAYHPLFQVLFVLQNNEQVEHKLGDIEVQEVQRSAESEVKFDLSLTAHESESGLYFTWGYCKDLFKQKSIEIAAEALNRLLKAIVAVPEQPLAEHELCADDAAQLPVGQIKEQQSIVTAIQARALTDGNHVAVIHQAQSLSYAQLCARAEKVAGQLMALGIGKGDTVAVMFDRSVELVVAQLAVMQSGAAYVPLDPTAPQERLQYIVSDAECKLVLKAEVFDMEFASRSYTLTELPNMTAAVPHATDIEARDLAYIIYTSGTTGRPKGVQVSHGAIYSMLSQLSMASFDSNTRMLQLLSLAFDAAVLEVWSPLVHGGSVVLYPGRHVEIDKLETVIKEHQVNTVLITPALFEPWCEQLTAASGLKHLIIGGDVFPTKAVKRLFKQDPNVTVYNTYGPTENSVISSYCEVPRDIPDEQEVTIGLPVAGTQHTIRNRHGKPLPQGFVGELCWHGPKLATGYQNNVEATNAAFVQDKQGQYRYYRSGDMARVAMDKQIDFKGRKDNQVKLRGFRVELQEIERQFELHSAVRQAAVLVNKVDHAQPLLCAYLCLHPEHSEGELEGIWQQVRAELPSYMIPTHYALTATMPVNFNGKRDDRALLAMTLQECKVDRYTAPQTETEQQLAEIWGQMLKLDRVGTRSNFFELGGHSLLAMQLISAINETFDLELGVADLFDLGDIASLAEEVDELLQSQESGWL